LKAILVRTYLEKETTGILRVVDDLATKVYYTCRTIELPNKNNLKRFSCIPEGCYKVIKEQPQGHFNYIHFRLLNVPGREGILIHIANYVSQLRGCIAVGKDLVDINNNRLLDVNFSGIVLKQLVNLLPDKFSLEIRA